MELKGLSERTASISSFKTPNLSIQSCKHAAAYSEEMFLEHKKNFLCLLS